MSGLGTQGLLSAVVSHAMASGQFDRVNGYEPKSPPGNGLTAAVWVQRIVPVPSSGLDDTSVLFVAQLRIYTNMLSEPQDAVDPALCDAADDLMSRYTGGFTLGGLVRQIDLLGIHGTPLEAVAGYITVQQTLYRCMTLTIPLLVNDAWDQGA
jgi:hypothetical protein